MKAEEMFTILLQDCREMLEVLKLINDENFNIESLKYYLDNIKIDGEGNLILPLSFSVTVVPKDNNMKIAIFLTQYLYENRANAFEILIKKADEQTGKLFLMADDMNEKFRKYMIEELG